MKLVYENSYKASYSLRAAISKLNDNMSEEFVELINEIVYEFDEVNDLYRAEWEYEKVKLEVEIFKDHVKDEWICKVYEKEKIDV